LPCSPGPANMRRPVRGYHGTPEGGPVLNPLLSKPTPDFSPLVRTLRGEECPSQAPLVDLFLNQPQADMVKTQDTAERT